jgi:UDP-2,4-diacetamido-2,4,6-trideoxy-beta-L-altropyranose hydrolase
MQIIFRAEGNSQIGLGHVMRLLALAEMLQPEFEIQFAIQAPSPALQEIFNNNIKIINLPSELNVNQEATWLTENIFQPQDVLVLDGYQFDTNYQELVKPFVARLICLDDIHAFPFVADVVVNPAGGVETKAYQLAAGTQLLVGSDYALLRTPFLAAAKTEREVKKVQRLFINLGGADPENNTLLVLQEINKFSGSLQLEVVLGSAYLHHAALDAYINQNPEIKINLHQNLTAVDICNLMQRCEAAVCSPSTVAYEWCCISGLLFIYRTADNQKKLENFLLREKLAFPFINLPDFINQPEILNIAAEQVSVQRKYFHGQSRIKWRQLFFKQVYPVWLSFRPAVFSDANILFAWINEPEVRQYSLNPAPVLLDIHLSWFGKKIQDKNSFIFIAEIKNEPAGMIRFDLTGNEALISYLLAKNYRGKGLGTVLLTKGITAFKKAAKGKVEKVTGLVQKQNIASVKAFEKAGFMPEEYTDTRHPSLLKFRLELTDSNKAGWQHE